MTTRTKLTIEGIAGLAMLGVLMGCQGPGSGRSEPSKPAAEDPSAAFDRGVQNEKKAREERAPSASSSSPSAPSATAPPATPEPAPLPDPGQYDYRPKDINSSEEAKADAPPPWFVLGSLLNLDAVGNGTTPIRVVQSWKNDQTGGRAYSLASAYKKWSGDWEVERAINKPIFLPRNVTNAMLAGDFPEWAKAVKPAQKLPYDPSRWAALQPLERRDYLEFLAAEELRGKDSEWNTSHQAEVRAYLGKKDTAYREKVAAALKGDIKTVEILSVINDPATYAGKTVKVVGVIQDIVEASPAVHADDLSGGEPREVLVVQARKFMGTDDGCFALDATDWAANADSYRALIKKRVEMIVFVKGPASSTKAPCIARILDVKKK